MDSTAKRPPPGGLATLPPELLYLIVSYLTNHRDLASLSLTSRFLHSFAYPPLDASRQRASIPFFERWAWRYTRFNHYLLKYGTNSVDGWMRFERTHTMSGHEGSLANEAPEMFTVPRWYVEGDPAAVRLVQRCVEDPLRMSWVQCLEVVFGPVDSPRDETTWLMGLGSMDQPPIWPDANDSQLAASTWYRWPEAESTAYRTATQVANKVERELAILHPDRETWAEYDMWSGSRAAPICCIRGLAPLPFYLRHALTVLAGGWWPNVRFLHIHTAFAPLGVPCGDAALYTILSTPGHFPHLELYRGPGHVTMLFPLLALPSLKQVDIETVCPDTSLPPNFTYAWARRPAMARSDTWGNQLQDLSLRCDIMATDLVPLLEVLRRPRKLRHLSLFDLGYVNARHYRHAGSPTRDTAITTFIVDLVQVLKEKHETTLETLLLDFTHTIEEEVVLATSVPPLWDDDEDGDVHPGPRIASLAGFLKLTKVALPMWTLVGRYCLHARVAPLRKVIPAAAPAGERPAPLTIFGADDDAADDHITYELVSLHNDTFLARLAEAHSRLPPNIIALKYSTHTLGDQEDMALRIRQGAIACELLANMLRATTPEGGGAFRDWRQMLYTRRLYSDLYSAGERFQTLLDWTTRMEKMVMVFSDG